MWGRLATCGGLSTRLGGSGTLVDRPIEIGRRMPSCPTKLHTVSSIGQTTWQGRS
jgi:hypothetical protein